MMGQDTVVKNTEVSYGLLKILSKDFMHFKQPTTQRDLTGTVRIGFKTK